MQTNAFHNRFARAALVLLAVIAVLPLAGARSMRHLRLEKSAPADSSTVDAPTAVSLWFTQSTELNVTRVLVKNAKGDTIPTKALTRDAAPKSPIVAAFRDPVVPGAYTVDWRTMAADGHVVRGTLRFTVRPKAP